MYTEFPEQVWRSMVRLGVEEIERLKAEIERQKGMRQNAHDQIQHLVDGSMQIADQYDEARKEAAAHLGAATAYQGELELIAEDLGVESIAGIRDAIRDHAARKTMIEEMVKITQEAEQGYLAAEERARFAEATNAALVQAASLMLGTPITSEHRMHASTDYWQRRHDFRLMIDRYRLRGSDYPGRGFLVELEQAHDRADKADRIAFDITRRWGEVQKVIAAWQVYRASDTKHIDGYYILSDALDTLARMYPQKMTEEQIGQALHTPSFDLTRALESVLQERERQDVKWGEQNNDPFCYLTVLVEEVGEFAQAALHTRFGGPAAINLREEAVHTAAVALAIVECLDRAKWGWSISGTIEQTEEQAS